MSDISELRTERDFLLKSIEDLDREHVSGAMEDSEYLDLRDEKVVKAAVVIRSLNDAEARLTVESVREQSRPKKVQQAAGFLHANQRMIWFVGIVLLLSVSVFGISSVVNDRSDADGITGSIADSSLTLIAKAQDQTSQGKASEAVKTYDKVLKIDPNNAVALTYRGWLLNLAGLQDDGLANIQKAIDVKPTLPDPHFFKGYILLNSKNDANGAVAEFETFLANNPPREMVSLVNQALTDAKARAAVGK